MYVLIRHIIFWLYLYFLNINFFSNTLVLTSSIDVVFVLSTRAATGRVCAWQVIVQFPQHRDRTLRRHSDVQRFLNKCKIIPDDHSAQLTPAMKCTNPQRPVFTMTHVPRSTLSARHEMRQAVHITNTQTTSTCVRWRAGWPLQPTTNYAAWHPQPSQPIGEDVQKADTHDQMCPNDAWDFFRNFQTFPQPDTNVRSINTNPTPDDDTKITN